MPPHGRPWSLGPARRGRYSAVQLSAFAASVESWAGRIETPIADVRIVGRKPALAAVEAITDGVGLTVDARLVAAPGPVRERVLAHEFAHLRLGHTGGLSRAGRRQQTVGGVATVVFTAGMIPLLVMLVHRGANTPHPVLSAFLLASFTAATVALAWAYQPARRRELAADSYAAGTFGLPFDDVLIAWRRRVMHHVAPRLLALWSAHPSTAARRRTAVAALGAVGS